MSYTETQLQVLRETATVAVKQGHPEQNYWAKVALQLIETLERERNERD